MDARTYLEQARSINRKIKMLDETYLRLKASLLGAQVVSDMPRVISDENTTENKFAKLAEVNGSINDEIDKLIDVKKDISLKIVDLNDPRLSEILLYYYVDGLCFSDIACKMGYSEIHIRRLFHQALRLFERSYKHDKK